MTERDPLATALDRFDVPRMSEGLAERIVRAVGSPAFAGQAAVRRDRRGFWRRGRHALVGTVAFGMLSAAAVASGLLGRVGVEIPVLSAMLAPKERAAPKPPVRVAVRPKPPKVAPEPPPVVAPVPEVQSMPTLAERVRLRTERRERARAFAEAHPRAAALVAVRVRQELWRREIMRRDALGLPPADPRDPGFRVLTPEERWVLRADRRRDLRRASAMIDRRLAARLETTEAESKVAANAAEVTLPTAVDQGLDAPPR